jgi:Mrp family chromosome partitioning ATPase/uncharacterized protein involved in exopolysaccharide biosynthesis
MDLITIIKVLWNRKWIIIIIPIISIALAIFLTFGYEKDYKSYAQLATGFTVAERLQVNEERFNIYEADVKFNNLIETMRSSRVLSLLSYHLLIHDLTADSRNERNKPFTKLDVESDKYKLVQTINIENMLIIAKTKLDSMVAINTYEETDRRLEDLLKAYGYDLKSLREYTEVQRVRGTDYVTVTAVTKNPLLSAFIVNKLCSEFIRFNSTNISERTSESVQTFARLVDQKKKELEEKSEKLREFKSNNSMINFSMESESKIAQLSDFEINLEAEEKKLRSIVLQLEDVENNLRALGGTLENNSNNDIIEIKRKIIQLNQRYIASGSNNQQILDSLNTLRTEQQRLLALASRKANNSEEIEQLTKKKSNLEVEKLISKDNIEAIKRNIKKIRLNVGGYASKEAQIAALEREVNLASEEYKNAQERYNNALDYSISSGNSIRQVLDGLPATEPEPSKRLIVTALSGASSLTLCILIILLIEYIDTSIKSISNFKKTVNLPLLGSLNFVEKLDYKFNELFITPRNQLKSHHNIFKDSLRKLRFELERMPEKIILVTSTQTREGKSTAIMALATALSNIGKSVLIIDMNFSNNELTRLIKPAVSIEDILISEESKIRIKISKTPIQNVSIIGCKGGSFSPFEKFEPKSFMAFLNAIKDKYDKVFIEGAAMNIYSDVRELSEYVDGLITVVSAQTVHRQEDEDSIEFINNVDKKNKGAILNKIAQHNLNQ